MNRRLALLVLVAILVLADLIGIVVLREAWSARHGKGEHAKRPAERVQPVNVAPGPELVVARAGT